MMDSLQELLEEIGNAPEVYRPSRFWQELTTIGLKQLEQGGFDNFKRSVNLTYFNWGPVGILQQQLLPVFRQWWRRPTGEIWRARFPGYRSAVRGADVSAAGANFRLKLPTVKSFDPASALLYRTYVAMLYEVVAAGDELGLLERLEEPPVGNPFVIQHRGRRISQDLCNSVHEFYSSGGGELEASRSWDIAELGAGYGRVGYVFLEALPRSTYTIIDIPPALNVAQEYLSRVFPRERVFGFRRFSRYEDVKEEFESARIRFLASHQIELIPEKQFDRFINISSLHEMSRPQIENYLAQTSRVCRGRFYSKQWRVSQAPVNGHVIREEEYPIPPSWVELYRRPHPIQRMFFEALYEVR